LGIGPNPQSPIPNPQSPIIFLNLYIINIFKYNNYLLIKFLKYKFNKNNNYNKN